MRPAECKAILDAPSESKGETLTACIGGDVGVGGMQEAAYDGDAWQRFWVEQADLLPDMKLT
ncbi:MAG: hypothetical protein K2K82_09315, partial [Muribaculaceae bacterium]|nr:hypothetical protein [Muribaculaceae bacterium]